MKKVIKMMLALLAALVCGGAWAATPIAVWDGDFKNTKKGDYTLSANGNTVATDGSSITIAASKGISIVKTAGGNIGDQASTVIIKYTNFAPPTNSDAQVLIMNHTADQAYKDFIGAASITGGNIHGIWQNTTWGSNKTSNGSYGSALTDTKTFAFSWAQSGTIGAYFWMDGANKSGWSTLHGKLQVDGIWVGGPNESTTLKPATGMKVLAIAVFDSRIADTDIVAYKFPSEEDVPSDIGYVAEATSNTAVDLSALTWKNPEGEVVQYSSIATEAKIAIKGNGKVNVTSRTGDVWLGYGVTGVLPNTGTVSTKFIGYGQLEKSGTGDLTLSGASTNFRGLNILAGTAKAGTAGGLGTGVITIAKGATMDINGQNGATGGYVVESAGSLKNSGSTLYGDDLCIKSLTLLGDTEFVSCNKRFGVSLNTQTATLVDLGNHTLTLNTGEFVNFRRTEFRGTGRVVVKNNTKMLVYDNTAYNSTMSDGTLILESGSHLELNVSNNGTFTVKNFVQKGSATHKTGVGGRLVVTGSYDVSAATTTTTNSSVPKLKLNGATVVFRANTATGAAFSLNCTDLSSDSSVKSGEHAIQVGDIAVMGTLTLNTTDKTVQYATNGSLVLKPAGNAIKLTDINAFACESAVTVEMPDNSYLDINTDSVTPASVTVNNAGKLTVVKTTSTGWGTITAETLPSKITIQNTDAQHLVFDAGSVKAEYFGKATTYWSNVYAGPTTSSEAGNASDTGEWWKRNSTSQIPLYTNGNYQPTLFDGNLIPLVQVGADGYKTINASLSSNNGWEGWELRVGAVNGVKINVAKLGKMQGDVAGFIGVDAASKLVINEYSNGNNRPSMVFDVASPNGVEILNVVVASRNEDNSEFLYNLRGDGSVSVGALLDRGASHKIGAVGIALGEGRYRAIKERKIVGGTVTKANFVYGFTDTATVTVTDKQGVQGSVCANAALTLLDEPGTAAIIKKTDGLYVQYIGYSDETPSEYMWKFNKASGNWSDANAWTGVLDTTGATHSWSELEVSTTPVTVFLDANVTSAITIDGTINAKKVILTNTSADPKPFAFNTTYTEGEGGPQVDPNVKLNAPVDTTAFNGELGLRGVITGEIAMGPNTQIVFVAPTEGQQTTAYDYTITGRANPIEVRGPGTFRVPSSMYTVPFKVMPTKTDGEYTGNAGYILFDIPTSGTVTVSDGIAGDGGVKKSGAGTLVITPASTYTGKTLVDAGKIKAGNNNSFGTTGDIEVAAGATLDINGKYLPNQIYLSGDGVDGTGALVNGTNIGSDHPWKITLRADASWGGSGFTHFGRASVVNLGGFTFTKKGSNNFPLNNTSGITNGKIVVEAGEFQNNGGVNNLSTVDLEIKSGATLNMNKGTSLTVKSFKCEGSITGTNAKLIIAQNGYLYESSASIPKLELLEGATVVAAANKKITIGTSLTAEAVNVNASAKTEKSDVTLFTMPSEADAIALAAKILLVGDAEQHIVVSKGADVCLAPLAVSDEEAFKAAVATAGDVTLGGDLNLPQTIDVADGVTIILGENTIRGGTLNLASGTITFHVEQGKSTTISSTITGAAKIRKTGGGGLTMSANNSNFTGSWEVVGGDLKGSQKLAYGHDVNGDDALTFKVDAGATLYIDKMDDISYNLVMAGGTVKNGSGNNIDLNHRQIRKMTLEADSRVEGANFGFVPGSHSNGTITLDGHTLTVAMASDNKFAFDGMTDDDVGGVIKVVSGKIGNASVQNEAVLSHTQIVLEGGAFECERQMTVKSVKVVSAGENSGTLKVKECVEGALAMPKLTLDDNATIKLADNQSVSVSTTLTLGANLKVNLTGITTAVGGEMTVLTAPSSFTFTSTTLTCVNNEGAADSTWILKANGNTLKAYRNAEVGGVCPSLNNNWQTFMVSSAALTIKDFAKNYTLAANFTGGNISGSPKPGTMIDARVANDIFTAQFQVLNSEMKWRNIEVRIVNEDGLYKAQIKNGTTGYENSSGAEDAFGKTGTTVRGGYQLSSFTATPGAMTKNFAFDGTVENGVVKSPTGWITSFNNTYSTNFTGDSNDIGPVPGEVVCKTTSSERPYAGIEFSAKSNFTIAFYANPINVDSSSKQAMLLCVGSGSKGIFLKKTTEGNIAMDLYNASSADYASDDIEHGKGFHLYTITRDAGKVYNLYIDGKKIATQYKAYNLADGFQIADPFASNSSFATGTNLAVANVLGYDRVLSDYQIAVLSKEYPAVPMAKAEGVDTPIRGVDASKLVEEYNAAKPGSAEEATSINSNGVNGLPLWKSDILGLDPTDENSTMVVISGAQTTDTGTMKLLTGIKPNPEIMTVTLKSGTTAACDDTDATSMADDGSFTVTLPTGDDKVKYYKLTYEFSAE